LCWIDSGFVDAALALTIVPIMVRPPLVGTDLRTVHADLACNEIDHHIMQI